MNLGIAISLTAEKFKNKVDKKGEPYILHCLRVMNEVNPRDKELQMIAVMHDLVEDTDVTLQDLRDLKFSERVVKGVEILTHNPEVPYPDYIKLVSFYPDAVECKLSDLKDNSDITRLKGLSKKDHERIEKYHISYTYLENL